MSARIWLPARRKILEFLDARTPAMGDPFDLGNSFAPTLRLHRRRPRFSLGVGELHLARETTDLITRLRRQATQDLWSTPISKATVGQILTRRILELQALDLDDAPEIPQGKGPALTRAGTGSDVLNALWGIPQVRRAAERTMEDASRTARRGWRRSSTGEKVLLISHSAVLFGGALGTIMADDEARPLVLGLLSGVDIPVPWVDGLSFRVNPQGGGVTLPLSFWVDGLSVSGDGSLDGNWTGKFSFDVMAFRRRRGR
jgi:hypothetical protein